VARPVLDNNNIGKSDAFYFHNFLKTVWQLAIINKDIPNISDSQI
jgi:hypothetical protein